MGGDPVTGGVPIAWINDLAILLTEARSASGVMPVILDALKFVILGFVTKLPTDIGQWRR